VQVLPGIWKADIKAAFRRVPLKAEHTWAAAVAFKVAGKVPVSSQTCAFGCLLLLFGRYGSPSTAPARLAQAPQCIHGNDWGS
jgi:hypothetical protein